MSWLLPPPNIEDEPEPEPTGITLHNRFEHTHVLGGTGHGKTQLLQYLIYQDLQTDACVIVVDNQRQMVPLLARLGYDMQYISPHYPLSLNLFDLPNEQNTSTLLKHVISSIMEAPLTAKQQLVFQFGTNLMLANRGTLHDFLDLLQGKQFDLSNVSPMTRKFFTDEYELKGTGGYTSTRDEIKWRIWKLFENTTLAEMFAAKENRCRLETHRKLILIDCDVKLLQEYSGMFAKFFIAQLLQLAHHRFVGQHRPIYLYLDEAYFFLDKSTTSLLETARKASIGLTIAHQNLSQLPPDIRPAIMSLTSTKFAGGVSVDDEKAMAAAMRMHPDTLSSAQKGHFFQYSKGHSTTIAEVPIGFVERLPPYEIDHTEQIRRYGRTHTTQPPDQPEPPRGLIVPDAGPT